MLDEYWNNGGQKYFDPGTWHKVKVYIKMNTITGSSSNSDGILMAWFDGEATPSLNINDMVFRYGTDTCGSNSLLGIDGFYFSTFFGGNDSTYAATKDEYVYFDNFIISEHDIQ